MKSFWKWASSIALMILCSACVREGSVSDEDRVMRIELQDNVWTYISLTEGKVVGTGKLGSEEDDSAWAARQDWDIALCNGAIRTNGGSSGRGKAAILEVAEPYEMVGTDSPATLYSDTAEFVISEK